ncbi:T9SS type A sorting domain-containing protein [Mesonia aquimarina]|uniref:T9SS type A sorting domain-containing protein n=1 Tax=Mesonia aquimarina TaxID=1504967 RepID=UPI0013CEDEDF|nr:T9SS type A sorting domain-containing protein [Mesonia aquimarina]
MKKTTLIFTAIIFWSILSLQAQNTLSFESSEGYNLGEVHGQQGWEAENAFTSLFVISDERSSDGVYALRGQVDAAVSVGGNELPGIINNTLAIGSGNLSISLDLYLETPNQTGAMDLFASAIDDSSASPRLAFVNGFIVVIDIDPQNPTDYDFDQVGLFQYNTWLSYRAEYDFTAGQVAYYVNDELLYTGAINNLSQFNKLCFFFLNQGDFYVDNVSLEKSSLSIENINTQDFTYHLSNSNAVLTLSSNNRQITSVEIFNILGQEVKHSRGNNSKQVLVDMASYKEGVYIVRTSFASGEQSSFKILKD